MKQEIYHKEIVYSKPVGQKKPGETAIYRYPGSLDKLREIPEEFQSMADLWDVSLKKFGDNKIFEDVTYTQSDQLLKKIGSCIIERGHKIYFIYAKNCVNWGLVDLAAWNYGLINVALYDTLGGPALEYILEVAEGTLMFASKAVVPNIHAMLLKKANKIRQICFFEEISAEQKQFLSAHGVEVTHIDSYLKYEGEVKQRPKINREAEISYFFTSGTTGIPKGVIYTHKMVLSQLLLSPQIMPLNENDQHMSFLPIAHAFERLFGWICLIQGTHITYMKYPITQFPKSLAEIKPTILTMVPRLLNKLYPIAKGIYQKQGSCEKVKGLFGGRVRHILTGSAPVAGEILTFFKEALGCVVQEGYGQTETCAGTFLLNIHDDNYGTVGGPNPSIQFKLVDVPQMNYTSDQNPPAGQVCVRGEPIFKQYFKNPEATAEAIDSDGWNHSGDIGIILPNGSLKIVDRKKNIFKLAQAEYIAPEKIQNIMARCLFVGESFVYGDSLKDHLIGFISPNLERFPQIVGALGLAETDPQKLCELQEVNKFILKEVTEQCKKDGLKGFEIVKRIKLVPKPFAALGLVTSTMKLQRYQAKKYFEKDIEKLYQA